MTKTQADIFTTYSDNIEPLTPMISNILCDTIDNYGADWTYDAIFLAVLYNKKNLKYIQAILKNWRKNGKTNTSHERSAGNRYITGKDSEFIDH